MQRLEQEREGMRRTLAGLSRYEGQLRTQYAQARAQDQEDIWALRNAFKEEERLLHDALRLVCFA